jgi:hypothetical protein
MPARRRILTQFAASAAAVTFQVELAAGKTRLQTLFRGPNGPRGAYYVYIRRL